MPNRIQKSRKIAYTRQDGFCYYCGQPTWLENPELFASQYKLTRKSAELLRCTAEHLKAKSDGGSNSSKNIVAACKYCNQHRHNRRLGGLSVNDYLMLVRKRVSRGRWHRLMLQPSNNAMLYASKIMMLR